ncbi:MAG TPA: flagellar basal body-associated FliL family protein [Acetobacteraceae bacterium]|nr:flagellar basal body-associated FliL family protein [Acetobacteraceae bacterium]
MAAADKTTPKAEGEPAKRGGRKRMLLLALPLLLAGIGAGLWFSGILPRMLGKHPAAAHAAKAVAAAVEKPAVYVDLPDIIANLNTPPRNPSFVKLSAKLEVEGAKDKELVLKAMPRIQDLFTTYLRDMRPQELRGSMGTYRLREELINRASIAAAPARILDVLFTQMIVQ